MISLQHLTKVFGAQTAVDALSFDIPAGQIIGFLGPNDGLMDLPALIFRRYP